MVNQFAGEIAYFSYCILNDAMPEPDGDEGWRDVRVIAAIERALTTGTLKKLEPLSQKRIPASNQRREYQLAKTPDMIDTESPTK